MYATVEQLANLVKVNATTKEADLTRVLETAAGEIVSEIGWAPADPVATDDLPTNWTSAQVLALCESVNLERGQDLWQLEQVPVGVLGLGGETPLVAPRNSWDRHAHRLSPIKKEWGIA